MSMADTVELLKVEIGRLRQMLRRHGIEPEPDDQADDEPAAKPPAESEPEAGEA